MMKKHWKLAVVGMAIGGMGAYAQYHDYYDSYDTVVHSEDVATVPSSPVQQAVDSTVIRSTLLPSTQPRVRQVEAKEKVEKAPVFGAFSYAGADASAGSWEYSGDFTKGVSFGLTPSVVTGETTEWTISLPMFWTRTYDTIAPSDHYQFDLGLDVKVNHYVNENLAVGGHVMAMRSSDEDRAGTDNKYSLTGGPFASYSLEINEKMDVTLGALLDMTTIHNDQRVTFGILGAKVGYHLTDCVAVNPYLIYYRNLHQTHDDEASLDDRDFFTGGLETNIAMGSAWTFAVGARSTLGYKDYKSLQGYVGTKFMF